MCRTAQAVTGNLIEVLVVLGACLHVCWPLSWFQRLSVCQNDFACIQSNCTMMASVMQQLAVLNDVPHTVTVACVQVYSQTLALCLQCHHTIQCAYNCKVLKATFQLYAAGSHWDSCSAMPLTKLPPCRPPKACLLLFVTQTRSLVHCQHWT